jgi:tetratricopeptide (TPR) repeat protein
MQIALGSTPSESMNSPRPRRSNLQRTLGYRLAASVFILLLLRNEAVFGQPTNLDYYNPGTDGNQLALFKNVHSYHLQPGLEALLHGNTKTAHDHFVFILNYYPNSPQALNGISELCFIKWKSPSCDADTWFDRAIARNPSIATTWVLFGIHLQRKGLPREAVEKYQRAIALDPGSINAHYNLGLAYLDLKEYAKANEEAQKSYALGAPLPGLRDKLVRAGAWKPGEASSAEPSALATPPTNAPSARTPN